MSFHDIRLSVYWTGLCLAAVSLALYLVPVIITPEESQWLGHFGILASMGLLGFSGGIEIVLMLKKGKQEEKAPIEPTLTLNDLPVDVSEKIILPDKLAEQLRPEPVEPPAPVNTEGVEDEANTQNTSDYGYQPEEAMFVHRDRIESFVNKKLEALSKKKTIKKWEVSPPFASLNSVSVDINPRDNTKVLMDTDFKNELLTLLPEGAELRAADRTHKFPRIVYPRCERQFIPTAEALRSFEVFCQWHRASNTTALLGYDDDMQLVMVDMVEIPHLLILGTTKSGKGVATHNILLSVLLRSPPDEVQLIRIDPKKTEFKVYDSLPHMLGPRATEVDDAFERLDWLVEESDRRQALFAEQDIHNIQGWNRRHKNNPMPLVFVVFDELTKFHELIKNSVEKDSEQRRLMTRLNGQLINLVTSARSAGIHLILVTQNAKDTIPGKLISELYGRLYFKIKKYAAQSSDADKGDLDQVEYLPGMGAGLWLFDGTSTLLQAPSIIHPEDELPPLVAGIRQRYSGFEQPPDPFSEGEVRFDDNEIRLASDDPLYLTVVRYAAEQGKISRPMLEKLDHVNRTRAEHLLTAMEKNGFVKNNGSKKARTVLVSPADVSAIMRKIGLQVASV